MKQNVAFDSASADPARCHHYWNGIAKQDSLGREFGSGSSIGQDMCVTVLLLLMISKLLSGLSIYALSSRMLFVPLGMIISPFCESKYHSVQYSSLKVK